MDYKNQDLCYGCDGINSLTRSQTKVNFEYPKELMSVRGRCFSATLGFCMIESVIITSNFKTKTKQNAFVLVLLLSLPTKTHQKLPYALAND